MRKIKWNFEIGEIVKDNRRDLTIIDRECRKDKNNKSRKWYKYHCNKDGYEGWIGDENLKQGKGCSACGGRPILGINTIWDTNRWMCDLGLSEEDAKTHTKGSNDKVFPTCPVCGRRKKKSMAVSTLYRTRSIGCSCGDGFSIPNKVMYSILEQLNIDFETEYSPEWIKPKRYDFYIPSLNIIIEMDGKLGHGNKGYDNNLTPEESKSIDDYKDEQATLHGIDKPIRIDCKYNSFENKIKYIKQNILKSRLNELFDLNKIDWNNVEQFAYSNFTEIACEYKRNNPDLTTTQIAEIMNVSTTSVNRWLRFGNSCNMCCYDSKEEQRKAVSRNGKNNGKPICIFKENILLSIFDSVAELERQSEKLFGVKLFVANITKVCNGKRNHTGGYQFKYVLDLTPEEYLKYDIENKLKELNNDKDLGVANFW